jgi:hypothetical protein
MKYWSNKYWSKLHWTWTRRVPASEYTIDDKDVNRCQRCKQTLAMYSRA